jgi:hypothetical protein
MSFLALCDVAGLIQENRFRVIDAQHRIEIARGHGVLEEVADLFGTLRRHGMPSLVRSA